VFDAALASVRAEALLHATNAFVRSVDLTELAHALADATRSLFAPSDVAVVFRDPTGVPTVFAADGTRLDGPGAIAESLGVDLLERGFAGNELSTDDAGSEAFRDRIAAYGARCGLALPISTSRVVVGVMYVLFDDTDTIDHQYRELARALAAQAGLAVELLAAREDLARQTRVTSALLAVSERLATLTDPGEVPGTLVAAIRSATGASLAAVARWSQANQRVEFAAIEGLTAEEQAGLLALNPGPELGIVQGGLEGRSAVFVAPFDPVDIPVEFTEALGVTAIAGAPITAGDQVWGFLLVATRPGDPSIVETGAELLHGFATITATAVGRTQAIALLERSHNALESAVAERTFELTQVVEELSRANRAKTEFLSNVSHELRTPLTSIVGFTDLLLHGMEGPLTEAQSEDLRTIDASGGRLLSLIDDLIEVSDIEAGRVELRIEPVALTPFLQERATEIRTFAGHKQQSVELESGRGPAIIYADEGRLRTVLRNLLSNAVKFTPAHGIIRIEAAGLEDDVRIDVADTGIGIAAADQAQIFERFHRASAPDVPGTGLGLAIAREYVLLHGGDLTVESTPGTGSRFSVWLPGAGASRTWRHPAG
jgi:signal transduction histidine kinase